MPRPVLPEVGILAFYRIDHSDGEVCSVRHCVSRAEYWASALCNPIADEIKVFFCESHYHAFEHRARRW